MMVMARTRRRRPAGRGQEAPGGGEADTMAILIVGGRRYFGLRVIQSINRKETTVVHFKTG